MQIYLYLVPVYAFPNIINNLQNQYLISQESYKILNNNLISLYNIVI
jgi:hypothetical protein